MLTEMTCPVCDGTGLTPTGVFGRDDTCRTCDGKRTALALRDGRYFIVRVTGANTTVLYALRDVERPRETRYAAHDFAAAYDRMGDLIANDYRAYEHDLAYTARTGKRVFCPTRDPRSF